MACEMTKVVWRGYFDLGCSRSVYRRLDKFVANRVIILLRRRHRVPARGERQYGRQKTLKILAFFVCVRRPWKHDREPGVKPVGEPDAGEPHVRFDERRKETGPWLD